MDNRPYADAIAKELAAWAKHEFKIESAHAEVFYTNGRADVVGIKKSGLIGFEIKSDRDSFDRLRSQIIGMSRVFDWNYVVVSVNKLAALEKFRHPEPDNPFRDELRGFGIITFNQYNLSGGLLFKVIKRATFNSGERRLIAASLNREQSKRVIREFDRFDEMSDSNLRQIAGTLFYYAGQRVARDAYSRSIRERHYRL